MDIKTYKNYLLDNIPCTINSNYLHLNDKDIIVNSVLSKTEKINRHNFYNNKNPSTYKQMYWDLHYLKIAEFTGQNSRAVRKKVGCIFVNQQNILADGFNGTPSGFNNACEDPETGLTNDYVIHAEMNAISKVAKLNISTDGATAYVTLSPCQNCMNVMVSAGIKRVVFSKLHSSVNKLSNYLDNVEIVYYPIEIYGDSIYETLKNIRQNNWIL